MTPIGPKRNVQRLHVPADSWVEGVYLYKKESLPEPLPMDLVLVYIYEEGVVVDMAIGVPEPITSSQAKIQLEEGLENTEGEDVAAAAVSNILSEPFGPLTSPTWLHTPSYSSSSFCSEKLASKAPLSERDRLLKVRTVDGDVEIMSESEARRRFGDI